MNATNKPIDILLSANKVQLPEADKREYGSSYSNIRENSFDRVLDDQRRIDKNSNRQSSNERTEEPRRPDETKHESHERETRKAAVHVDGNENKQAKVESKDGNESGNALPDKVEDSKEPIAALAEDFANQVALQQQLNVDQTPTPIRIDSNLEQGLVLNQVENAKTTINPALPLATVDPIKPVPAEGKVVAEVNGGLQQLARLLADTSKPEMTESHKKGIKLDILADKGTFLSNELKALLRNLDVPAGNLKASSSSEALVLTAASGKPAENRGTAISNLLHSLHTTGLTNSGKAGMSSGAIQLPVSSPNWGQAVAQRIAWLAGSGVQAAQLQLNPQDLGPVDVKINVTNEQASINFTSQHGAVREALNQSLDSLREMLENSGLSLVDVNVSDQSLNEGNKSDSESAEGTNNIAASSESENETAVQTEEQQLSTSLIDYYA